MALLVFLLLPGLLLTRSPWWAVPFLSLSCWWASWAWLAPAGPGRLVFLQASLAVLGPLLLLRLVRSQGVSWPQASALLAFLLSLAAFLAVAGQTLPLDADLAFHAMLARLLTWRDGIPATLAPLAIPFPFRTHAPALPFLAADAALLAGGDPHRLTLLGAGLGPGLLSLGAFAGSRRWLSAWWPAVPAAASALAGVLALPLLGASLLLALAFDVAAAALVIWPLSNARAVSIGAFLGAGVLADLRSWPAAAALLMAGVVRLAGGRPDREPVVLRLAGLALLSGLLVAGPAGWRLAPAPFVGKAFPSVRVALTARDLQALTRLGERTPPAQVVCIEPGAAGIWIPAAVGRAVSAPHLPLYLQPPEARPAASGPCSIEPGRGSTLP